MCPVPFVQPDRGETNLHGDQLDFPLQWRCLLQGTPPLRFGTVPSPVIVTTIAAIVTVAVLAATITIAVLTATITVASNLAAAKVLVHVRSSRSRNHRLERLLVHLRQNFFLQRERGMLPE